MQTSLSPKYKTPSNGSSQTSSKSKSKSQSIDKSTEPNDSMDVDNNIENEKINSKEITQNVARNNKQVKEFLIQDAFFTTEMQKIKIDHVDFLKDWFGDINPAHTLQHLTLSAVFWIPASMQKLYSLTHLEINNCTTIPDLSALTNLSWLEISNCNLTKIPIWVYNLRQLQRLNVKHNVITHLISNIYLLPELTHLLMAHNRLQYVANLDVMRKLKHLKLSHNVLKEVEIRNDSITRLDLNNNELYSLKLSTPALRILDLSMNQFSTFPTTIKYCLSLTNLDLSINHIRTLDAQIGSLKRLEILNLNNNKIKLFAHSITELESLTHFTANHNELIDLPPDFENLKELSSLSLIDNKLTKIPDSIAKLPRIETVDLEFNQIRKMPSALQDKMNQNPQLEVDVSDNPMEELQLSYPNVKSLVRPLYKESDPLFEQIDFVRNLDEMSLNVLREYTDVYDVDNRSKQKDKFILNLFEQVPPLKKSLKVYRGVKSFPYQQNRQFVSTSLYKDAAFNFLDDFSCCLLVITLQVGTKILPLREISHHEIENEILLNGNGIFEIVQQRTVSKLSSQVTKSQRFPIEKSTVLELGKSLGVSLPAKATLEKSIEMINQSQKLKLKTYYLNYNYMGKANPMENMRMITFNLGTNIQLGKAEGTEKLFVELCQREYNFGTKRSRISPCSQNALDWLKEQNADLIGLQELTAEFLDELKVQFAHLPDGGVKYQYAGYENSICLIYNGQMLGEASYLSDDNLFFVNNYRPMLIVYFPKVKLVAVNLHAEHDIALKTEIEDKYNTILSYYPDLEIDRVVVLGDFNDTEHKLKSLYLSKLSCKQHSNIVPTCCADSNYQYYGDYIFDSDYNLIGRYGTPLDAIHPFQLEKEKEKESGTNVKNQNTKNNNSRKRSRSMSENNNANSEKLVRTGTNRLMSDHDPVVFYPGL